MAAARPHCPAAHKQTTAQTILCIRRPLVAPAAFQGSPNPQSLSTALIIVAGACGSAILAAEVITTHICNYLQLSDTM